MLLFATSSRKHHLERIFMSFSCTSAFFVMFLLFLLGCFLAISLCLSFLVGWHFRFWLCCAFRFLLVSSSSFSLGNLLVRLSFHIHLLVFNAHMSCFFFRCLFTSFPTITSFSPCHPPLVTFSSFLFLTTTSSLLLSLSYSLSPCLEWLCCVLISCIE